MLCIHKINKSSQAQPPLTPCITHRFDTVETCQLRLVLVSTCNISKVICISRYSYDNLAIDYQLRQDRRQVMISDNTACKCFQKHFEEECYKIYGPTGKRVLLESATPTIFAYKRNRGSQPHSNEREKRVRRRTETDSTDNNTVTSASSSHGDGKNLDKCMASHLVNIDFHCT